MSRKKKEFYPGIEDSSSCTPQASLSEPLKQFFSSLPRTCRLLAASWNAARLYRRIFLGEQEELGTACRNTFMLLPRPLGLTRFSSRALNATPLRPSTAVMRKEVKEGKSLWCSKVEKVWPSLWVHRPGRPARTCMIIAETWVMKFPAHCLPSHFSNLAAAAELLWF